MGIGNLSNWISSSNASQSFNYVAAHVTPHGDGEVHLLEPALHSKPGEKPSINLGNQKLELRNITRWVLKINSIQSKY